MVSMYDLYDIIIACILIWHQYVVIISRLYILSYISYIVLLEPFLESIFIAYITQISKH